MLYSIQEIKQIYSTGDNPVLVECNDLRDYVCKHNRGALPAYKLFAEWLVHSFLEELNIRVATKQLVEIKEEHVLISKFCQPIFFKNIKCFATEFHQEAIEWSLFPLEKSKWIINKEDLLIIAFCDIWLANEDRNWNNFNLLTSPSENGWEIIPIDHAGCFNSLSFSANKEIYGIEENESIIMTEQFRSLIKPKLKNVFEANRFAETLYLRIQALEHSFDHSVLSVAEMWQIPSGYIHSLKDNLFRKEWLDETKNRFLTYLKSSLSLK